MHNLLNDDKKTNQYGQSCKPKISYIQLDEQKDDPENGHIYFQEGAGQYLIMGCAGIWDVATNQEAADIVREVHQAGGSCEDISKALVQAALKATKNEYEFTYFFRYTTKNITIIVMKL